MIDILVVTNNAAQELDFCLQAFSPRKLSYLSACKRKRYVLKITVNASITK